MSDTGSLGILFLEKEGATFYYGQQNFPVQLNPPYDILRDMEVVSEEKLTLLFRGVISQIKPVCTSVIVILSHDYTFDKEFPNDPLEKFTNDVTSYQDLIPFENVSRKTLKTNKGWTASFANKDLCESLKTSFEKLRIIVIAVAPFSLLGLTVEELSKGFNYKLIKDKIDLVKQYSFLRDSRRELPQKNNPIIKNNTLGLILVVFLFSTAFFLIKMFY